MHRVSSARVKLAAIVAAVAGLTASRVKLGMFMPDPDADVKFFQGLNSRAFESIEVDDEVATAHFDGKHSFKVGDLVTVVCADAEDDVAGVHEIAAKTGTSISWDADGADDASCEFAQGDLIFTTPLVVIGGAQGRRFDAPSEQHETSVELLMYFGLQAVDQDYLALESVAYALRDEVADQSNWAANCAGPDDVTIEGPTLLRKTAPIAGIYTVGLRFKGV